MNDTDIEALVQTALQLKEENTSLLPALLAARKRVAETRDEADQVRLDTLHEEVAANQIRLDDVLDAIERASGIRADVLEELAKPKRGVGLESLPRLNLTASNVQTTAFIDDELSTALDLLRGLLPRGWLDAEPADPCRLHSLAALDGFLSLSKSLRVGSEMAGTHRLRQMVRVAEDFLAGKEGFDHFAGATLLPTLVQFSLQAENLRRVNGDVDGRLARLWQGSSESVDSTFFELLTAARCADFGREPEFISEESEKTPDLRCMNPFPLAIECKRQRPLSIYEIEEDVTMRQLFERLRSEALRKGLTGRLKLQLTTPLRLYADSATSTRLFSRTSRRWAGITSTSPATTSGMPISASRKAALGRSGARFRRPSGLSVQ